VNIRKFLLRANSLEELVRLGTMTAQCARFLEASVVAGLNMVVAGATQAGKTTLVTIPQRPMSSVFDTQHVVCRPG
jgi:pilus assembly protein CpaF